MPTRLAVAGAGLVGKRHIEAISNVEGAVLAGIVDPDVSAREHAKSVSADWYPSLAEMFAAARPDGVIIATPNQVHVENGLECIAAGIPVLVEKPIASDVRSAEMLVGAAEAAGVAVLVGHHRRHNPLIKAAKAQLDAGAIGEIVSVHGMCWLYKPDEYFDVNWRTEPGAGPVFINLIHDIDLLRHLCGEISSVQAVQSSAVRGHAVEDTAAILIQFENGAPGTLSVSDTVAAPWSWELTAGENPAYPETDQSCYYIGGTYGSLELPKVRIWTHAPKRSWWDPISPKTCEVERLDPLDEQIDHFCRVISGGEEPLVSGREGLRTLQVIEAVKHAAQTGRRVQLSGE